MTAPPRDRDQFPTDSPEVRSYLKKLLSVMLFGIVIMSVIAVWAWNKYGGKLQDRPPLPAGAPPISSGPITTR